MGVGPTGYCLLCGSRRKIHCRGQCKACYELSASEVRAGNANWKSLERRGLALKPERPGPRPSNLRTLLRGGRTG